MFVWHISRLLSILIYSSDTKWLSNGIQLVDFMHIEQFFTYLGNDCVSFEIGFKNPCVLFIFSFLIFISYL